MSSLGPCETKEYAWRGCDCDHGHDEQPFTTGHKKYCKGEERVDVTKTSFTVCLLTLSSLYHLPSAAITSLGLDS